MEAFSLLNYWKGGGGVASGLGFLPRSSDSTFRHSAEPIGTTSNPTTIVTSVSVTETDDDEADDDEGPFFDLEFAVPVEDEEGDEENNEGEVSDDEDGDEIKGGDEDCTGGGCDFKFMLSSCSSGEDRVDPGLDFSHSDDLFFKGQIVEEIEPPSSSSTGTEHTCSVKAPAAQLSASILKSATKLRVFMLKMKKSKLIQAKSEKSEANFGSRDLDKQKLKHSLPTPLTASHSPESQSQSQSQQKSTVTVNIKVEEVPIISLLARDNSSRNSSTSSSSSPSSLKKQNGNESVVSDEKRFVKMQKYLKKVKPLYIRVSRRYGEKLRHSGQLTFGSSAPSARSTTEKANIPATKSHKPGSININIPAGLKVVRKHLGKSRSSSSATPSSPASAAVTPSSESRRRDDSLLQQEDSIQSAILHCKKSFNSSRDKDQSVLPRSVSDSSSYEK